jgi:hypothetical protein
LCLYMLSSNINYKFIASTPALIAGLLIQLGSFIK